MRRVRPFHPNERDVQIIQLVHEHRFMSVELLEALLSEAPAEGKVYGFGLSGLRARCQKLREHRYLVRRFLQDQPTGRGYHTPRSAVYSVGSASVDLLADRTGLNRPQLNASIEKNALTSFFIRHFLGIAKFRVCLELACRSTNGKVRIGTWLQDGLQDHVDVDIDGKIERIPVVPDALFSLIVKKSSGKVALSHFALELDMGTMPLKRIVHKARGYWHYLHDGLHRRRYTYAGKTADNPQLRVVQGEWNKISLAKQELILARSVHTLQVLFVIRASEPDLGRVQTGEDPVRLRQRNIIRMVEELGATSPTAARFLFCTEDIDYNVSSPNAILREIWSTTEPCVGQLRLLPQR